MVKVAQIYQRVIAIALLIEVIVLTKGILALVLSYRQRLFFDCCLDELAAQLLQVF
jgi:hypothetical protein